MSFIKGRFPYSCLPIRFISSLLLFTADDFLVILLPNAVCGLAIASAGSPFPSQKSGMEVMARAPAVVLWIWLNLLLFNVSNQVQDASIEEDKENKPWRPLPAQVITQTEAKALYIALWPFVLIVSAAVGGTMPSISLQLLTLAYNDFQLGDSWPFRNSINAGGYISFLVGAVQVALNTQWLEYSGLAIRWLSLVGVAVATGIHGMDLYDRAGDLKRGRRTLPIALGDRPARMILLASILVVSLSAPAVIGVSFVCSSPAIVLASVIGGRLYFMQSPCVHSDKLTFRIWCFWIISLYLLPAFDSGSKAARS